MYVLKNCWIGIDKEGAATSQPKSEVAAWQARSHGFVELPFLTCYNLHVPSSPSVLLSSRSRHCLYSLHNLNSRTTPRSVEARDTRTEHSVAAAVREQAQDGACQELLHLDGKCILPHLLALDSGSRERDIVWTPYGPGNRRGKALACGCNDRKRRLNALYGNRGTSRRHASKARKRSGPPSRSGASFCTLVRGRHHQQQAAFGRP